MKSLDAHEGTSCEKLLINDQPYSFVGHSMYRMNAKNKPHVAFVWDIFNL